MRVVLRVRIMWDVITGHTQGSLAPFKQVWATELLHLGQHLEQSSQITTNQIEQEKGGWVYTVLLLALI